MTGDGYGDQPLGCQLFSLQPPEAGCQLPMAERPIPELPMPVPVTRHHVVCLSLYSILHTQYSRIHFCTFAQEHRSDLHLCTASLWSTGPLINRSTSVCPLSPCPRACMPPPPIIRFPASLVSPLHARHPSPGAATCHPKRCHLPILNTPYSILRPKTEDVPQSSSRPPPAVQASVRRGISWSSDASDPAIPRRSRGRGRASGSPG